MKKRLKFISVFVMIAVLASCLVAYVFATTNTQDGLEATIVTDKQSYSSGDDVVVKITVKNTTGYVVKNVSIEGMIPTKLKLKENNSLKKDVADLQLGETMENVFAATISKTEETTDLETTTDDINISSSNETSEPIMSTTEKISTTEDVSTTEKISTTEDVSTTEKITTTEETINTTTTVPTEISSTIGFDKGTTASALESAKDENITSGDDVVHTTTHNNVEKSEIPNTGESKTSIIAFAILLTISIMLIAICFKTKFRKTANKVISIMLCALIAFSGIFGIAIKAGAIVSNRKSFIVSETVGIDGKEYTISGKIEYDKITDDDMIETIDEVTESITTLQKSDSYRNASTEEKTVQMKKLLEKCEKTKKVKNIRYCDSNNELAFLFDYGNGGAGGVVIASKHNNDCFASASCAENVNNFILPLYTNTKKEVETSENKNWTFIFGASKNGDANSYNYLRALSKQYKDLGENINFISEATVDSYKNLKNNSLIYIMSHGAFYEGESYICTNEETTNEKENEYREDIEKENIQVFVSNIGVKHFYIRASFFTNNYKTDDLNNSIVLISCCCFYGDNNKEDYSFANAFRKIGVESVVGFCNSVGQPYANWFLEKVISFLSQGYLVKDAFNNAKNVLGKNENVFYELLDHSDLKKEVPAYPILSGDYEFALKKEPIEGFGTFMATVKDIETKAPIEGVGVGIYQEESKELMRIFKTDENGQLSLDLPEGEYICDFNHESYNNAEISIKVTRNTITYYFEDVYLVPKTNAFTGKILDSITGQPISNVEVRAFAKKNGVQALVETAFSSSNGEFELSLPSDTYVLEFEHQNYVSGSSEISIPVAASVKFFHLVPKGSANFYVKDDSGKDISSASVSVYEKSTSKQVGSGLTNINGCISFKLSGGEYVAEISKAGYESKTISVFVDNGKENKLQVVLFKKEPSMPEDSYIKIYTLSDFKKIADAPNKNYILMNDITLNGNSPCNSITFTGVFDGNGHSIKNSNGLIFLINKGTIRNLTLENVNYNLKVGHQYASFTYGVLARDNCGKIKNCVIKSGEITVSRYFSGYDNYWTELIFGGIVGSNQETGIIEDCINSVNITINGTGFAKIGGISAGNSGKIRHCLNTGNLRAYVMGGMNPPVAYTQSYVSGISSGGTIENCGNAAGIVESTASGENNPSAHLNLIGNKDIKGANYVCEGMEYNVKNYTIPRSVYLCKENVTFVDAESIRKEWNYNF